MARQTPFPWGQCSDFILRCGDIHEPYRFCVNVIESLREIVPYDQAVLLMLDGNRKLARTHFVGFTDRWKKMYLDYYSRMSGGDFSLDRDVSEMDGRGRAELIDWHAMSGLQNDFMRNYIRPRRLSQTLSLTLFDLKGGPASSIALDKLVDGTFSERDFEVVRLITAHLNNLYKNLFARPVKQVRIWDGIVGIEDLTPREREVLDLLCQGVKPVYIARELRISVGTANKHIAHIYQKLGVNSKQELLVKLLGK